jgi:hypothetical protein
MVRPCRKDSLDLVRAGWSLLPKNEKKKEEAGLALERAEAALKRSDAALAQKLGYQLCQCTFPPQIMLWNGRAAANRLSKLRTQN